VIALWSNTLWETGKIDVEIIPNRYRRENLSIFPNKSPQEFLSSLLSYCHPGIFLVLYYFSGVSLEIGGTCILILTVFLSSKPALAQRAGLPGLTVFLFLYTYFLFYFFFWFIVTSNLVVGELIAKRF